MRYTLAVIKLLYSLLGMGDLPNLDFQVGALRLLEQPGPRMGSSRRQFVEPARLVGVEAEGQCSRLRGDLLAKAVSIVGSVGNVLKRIGVPAVTVVSTILSS